MRTHRVVASVALVAGAVILPGCTRGLPTCRPAQKTEMDYFRVDYRVRSEEGIVPRAEVRGAQKFPSLRASWSEGTAAIRLPESCSGEGAGTGTGALSASSERQKAIMATLCGFWLAELERALVKAKYKVISWNALNQLEKTKQIPTYVAAKELGADVVFLVNSLDAGVSYMGKAFSESFKFFDSDEEGAKGTPRELDDKDRRVLKDFVRDRTQILRNDKLVIGIKAVLDMTAVETKSGEAVWFYLKQESKPIPVALDRRFLFAKYKERQWWWPTLPKSLKAKAKQQESKRASSDEESGEEGPRPADAYNAEVNELVRTIVDDFMTRFRGDS